MLRFLQRNPQSLAANPQEAAGTRRYEIWPLTKTDEDPSSWDGAFAVEQPNAGRRPYSPSFVVIRGCRRTLRGPLRHPGATLAGGEMLRQ